MFVIECVGTTKTYYLVEGENNRFRWASGDGGQQQAKRFRTQAAAATEMTKHRGAGGGTPRIVPAPRAPRRPAGDAGTGKFIVLARGTRVFYLLREGGSYRWRHGEPSRLKALRFETREAAQAVIDGGQGGAGGANAEVVEAQD